MISVKKKNIWNSLGDYKRNLSFPVLFLAMSTFFEFLCILLYAMVFPKLPIVKYYRSKAASEGSKTVSADLAAAGIPNNTNQGGVLQLFFNLIIIASCLANLLWLKSLKCFRNFHRTKMTRNPRSAIAINNCSFKI